MENTKELNKVVFKVKGMSCVNCAQNLEKALEKEKGVVSVQINFPLEKAYLSYDSNLTSEERLIQIIEKTGYKANKDVKINQISLKISSMSCSTCAQTIEENLKKLKGVVSANVNFATEKGNIKYIEDEIGIKEIKELIVNSGYSVDREEIENEVDSDLKKVKEAAHKMYLALGFAIPVMILMMINMFFISIPNYLTLMLILGFFPIVIVGWDTHKSSLNAIKNLSPNMDTLVSMGSIIPYFLNFLGFIWPIYSFVEMATSIMAFHMIGKFLEVKAKGKASQAIKKLLKLEAKTANIIENGKEIQVPIEEVKIKDIIIIRPGEKVPTDGVVISGESAIDESMATGEAIPVKKAKGDNVIGGTINKQGSLKIKATKVGKDTFLSQVIKMVEECQGSKVPIQEFADRITGFFVPVVILIALLAFIMWLLFPSFFISIVEFFNLPWSRVDLPEISLAILAMIAVLVISCPCALGLATPTAIMVGSGRGAEKGVLIRKGEAIQTIKETKIICFDKTGTITKGKPELTDILNYNGFTKQEVLVLAASLELNSEHPLGDAIVQKAKGEEIGLIEVEGFSTITGKGVEGIINNRKVLIGNRKIMKDNKVEYEEATKELKRLENEAKTAILLAVNGKLAGLLAVADTLKDDSIQAIKEIEEMGINTAMITGDNQRTAKAIANKVGISHVLAEVLPDGKVAEIKKLQNKYGTVAMVGDGINDAPALKQANVGIAIGTGTDIAIESADITLIRGDLSAVISAIKLSQATFKKIKENYFWAWFYNGLAIPAAFVGLIHPIIGAMAMFISSINVVLNSIRLKKAKIEPNYLTKKSG